MLNWQDFSGLTNEIPDWTDLGGALRDIQNSCFVRQTYIDHVCEHSVQQQINQSDYRLVSTVSQN